MVIGVTLPGIKRNTKQKYFHMLNNIATLLYIPIQLLFLIWIRIAYSNKNDWHIAWSEDYDNSCLSELGLIRGILNFMMAK